MHSYWNDWNFGWGWILWIGFIFLLFSNIGSWGYSYRAHRRVDGMPSGQARDILDSRYARGEITREQYGAMKADMVVG